MTAKPPLESFCHACQLHWKTDGHYGFRHLLLNQNHPVTFFNADTKDTARAMGVPVDKLL